jgi:hypothetical protein
MDFKNFYIQEAKTDHSITNKIEEMFVDVLNKGSTKYKSYEQTVKSLVNHFNLQGKAIHVGADSDGKLSDIYLKIVKELGQEERYINKTPKTDIIVNDDKISMKMDKGWIFAHLLTDTKACFDYTISNSTALQDKIKEQINFIFKELKNKEHKELYNNADSKIFKDILIDRLKEILNDNYYELKQRFIQAGLRGTFKFEETDKACANKLMVVKFKDKNNSSNVALKSIDNINLEKSKIYDLVSDMNYIKQIAEKSRISFVIQKSGKLRFDINSIQLDKNILSEGVFETLSDLLKQGYDKVKHKIEQIAKYLIDLINKGIQYLFNLLGISINVEMQNEIEF